MTRPLLLAALAFGLAACQTNTAAPAEGSAPAEASMPAAAPDSTAHLVHDAYGRALNANNLDSLVALLTDDVVFLAPNERPYVGKAAVQPWLEGYLATYTTRWDRTAKEFVVHGDWAFERYAYTSTDTPRAGGEPVVGTGWGLVIYHRDADGVWRVARDAWGSDKPVPLS